MTRPLAGLDRLAALVVGAALIVGGLAAVLWQEGRLPGDPYDISAPRLVEATERSWWQWVLLGGAIVCAVAGLWWLFAHRARRRLRTPRRIRRTGRPGIPDAARAAATEFGREPGVRSVRSRAFLDRGRRRTVELTADVDPRADLVALAAAADDILAGALAPLGPDLPAARTLLHVDRAKP